MLRAIILGMVFGIYVGLGIDYLAFWMVPYHVYVGIIILCASLYWPIEYWQDSREV